MPTKTCLDSIQVRHFRGLRDIELKNLGSLNLLLGANDAGKTSLLEAIFLLSGCSNLSLAITVQNQRQLLVQSFEDLSSFFYNLDIDNPISIAASMSDAGSQRTLTISAPEAAIGTDLPAQDVGSAQHKGDSKEAPGQGTSSRQSASSLMSPRILLYRASISDVNGDTQASYDGKIAVHSPESINLEEVRKTGDLMIPARIVRSAAGYDGSALAEVLVSKMEGELLEIINNINPQIQHIAMKGDIAYIDIGLDKMIPLNVFGSGIVRAANILSHCLLGRARILLIDELEIGLHYQSIIPFLRSLLVLSENRGVQIFATSHSLDTLNALQTILSSDNLKDLRSRAMCYVLARDSQGLVAAYDYDYSQFSHCLENGIEIR